MPGAGLGTTVKAIETNLWRRMEGARMGAREGKGNVFFVNGGFDGVTEGIDSAARGTIPTLPLLTITYALTRCTDNNDDFIYCCNMKDSDTYPIHVTTPSVHIIGVTHPDGGKQELQTSDDNSVFILDYEDGGVSGIEIAGFTLGGGATSPCIELEGANYNVWIHECSFGHAHNVAAQDGILITAVSTVTSLIVENCYFYGSTTAPGKLARYGIYSLVGGGRNFWHSIIRNNYFLRVPTVAINLQSGTVTEVSIIDNKFGRAADAQGNAITLGAGCAACLVAGNEAGWGPAVEAGLTTPWLDQAGGTANDWASNQSQEMMHIPD